MIELSHFSHRHILHISYVKEDDEEICSGCELDLFGLVYSCSKPNCHFFLHQSCAELPRQTRHKSHPRHPLTLQMSLPYSEGEFTCNACGNSGHAFTFHCTTCKFDLHVNCASLPEVVESEDHDHPLNLLDSIPSDEDEEEVTCDACDDRVGRGCWAYSCLECKYHTHLECGIGHEDM